jgi:formylglycine-generating enzyme required for sulfatase activity
MHCSKTFEAFVLGLGLCALACERDPEGTSGDEQSMSTEETGGDPTAGGNEANDGVGEEAGDGDSGGGGGGEGEGNGDGDGDGEGAGDGDGDGDGEAEGGGDGDGEAEGGEPDPALCASTCGTPGCGDCPVTTMIDTQWFYIDGTEITVSEYAKFEAIEFDPIVLSPTCAWKQDVEWFEPNDWEAQQSGDPDNPVTGIDWCDAQSYCAWAGKRLCGAVGGGPALLEELAEANNEWHRACTAGGLLIYPYGNNYKKFACNGVEQGMGTVVPVGSLPNCEGGVTGLWDMSGNLWEWTNACGEVLGLEHWEQDCQRRGGSFHSSDEIMRCGVDSRRHRGYRDDNTGIRCCSD